MKKTLTKLWSGDIDPCNERMGDPWQEDRLYHLVDEKMEKLNELLNEEEKKILMELDDCHYQLRCFIGEEGFVKGFSLGAKMMGEALLDD